MANDKMVEQITSMDEDFAKWYTDICKKADLIDYSSVIPALSVLISQSGKFLTSA